jgi:hypothetical protein
MHRHTGLVSATLVAAALLAWCASAAAASVTVSCNKTTKAGGACSAKAGPLRAAIIPSTHTPKVNASWPLKVTATAHGKPARASAIYRFLFDGVVVSTQYPRFNKHFSFTGQFSDTLVFPPDSAGQPLTLEVLVSSGADTVALGWSIDVKLPAVGWFIDAEP